MLNVDSAGKVGIQLSLPPNVGYFLTGDFGDAENLDELDHRLPLADKDVSLTRFADNIFRTPPLIRHEVIMDDSGPAHEIPGIFLRFEQERSGVPGIKNLVDHRWPEKIGQKSGDCIPFSHPRTEDRGVVRTPPQAD